MPRVAKSAAFRSPRRQLLSGVQADGFTGLSPCALSVSRGRWAAALSCRPGDRGAVLLCFHPQGSDAGGLAVRLAVQLVAIEAGAHPGCAEEAAHVSLSHVAAGPGDPEELGDAAGRMGVSMGGHAGGHRLAGDHAGRHGGGGSIVANPGGVLDLGVGKEASGLPRAGYVGQLAWGNGVCPAPAWQGSPVEGQPVRRACSLPAPASCGTLSPDAAGKSTPKPVCQPGQGRECSRVTPREQDCAPPLSQHLFIYSSARHFSYFFLYHEHFSQHRELCVIHGVSVVQLITEGSGRKGCCEAADPPSFSSSGQLCLGKGYFVPHRHACRS